MKFEPHEYQKHCIEKIIELPALALFLEMGLGKTVIVLSALQDLKYNRLQMCRTLIVAPKKVAEATWQQEAMKWDHLHLLNFSTVLGTQNQRIKALCQPADIFVTNRDNLPWLVDYYKNDWPFDTVVLDESSSFKNAQTKRFKKLKAIRPHINRIIELTGTPSPQGLIDLWPQVYLLDGGARLGKSITQFRQYYFDPDKRSREQIFSYKPKMGTEVAIKERISDICISMSAKDYINLPDMIEHDIPVMLDSDAMKSYKKMERDTLLAIDDEVITAQTAAVLTGKLLQLSNGALYKEDKEYVEVHKCKLEAFIELIEGLQNEHALVFYNFKHDKDRILNALQKSGLEVRVLKDSQDALDWNAGEVDILLAHPASCAYGLNLQQGGHHIIWFGLNWSLELVQQANARLHRQGQKEPVIVHRLVTQGTRDEDVVLALEGKADVQQTLMDSLRVRIEQVRSERQ